MRPKAHANLHSFMMIGIYRGRSYQDMKIYGFNIFWRHSCLFECMQTLGDGKTSDLKSVPDPSSSPPPPAGAARRSARSLSSACPSSPSAGTPGTGHWPAARCASADCVAVSPSPAGDTLGADASSENLLLIRFTAGICHSLNCPTMSDSLQ